MNKIQDIIEQIPRKAPSTVWHVGSLNPKDKGTRGASFEGRALSVSLCPAAWQAIARLGGMPCWELTRRDGQAGNFLDVTKLSPELAEKIQQVGIGQGWLCRTTLYKTSWYDEEDGQQRYSFHREKARALDEMDANEDGAVALESVECVIGTDALAQHHNLDLVYTVPRLALEMVLSVWAQEYRLVDGLWWEEELNVALLSAPRGCISPSQLSQWDRRVVPVPRNR